MTNMKQELKKINDELMELYNKPSMALHFQPTNLRVLRRLITKLVLLEKKDESQKETSKRNKKDKPGLSR